MYWSLGEYLQAKEVLEEGVSQFPEAQELRYTLAEVQYELDYPNRSRDLLLPLLEEDDIGDARLHACLARAYSDLGEEELSKEHAQLAQEAPGESPIDSDFHEEVEILDITEWEDRSELHRVVDALIRDGNYAKAWEKANELLEAGYDSSKIQRKIGDIAEETGRHEEAEEHYERAISLDETNEKAFHHYANFLKHRGRNLEAQEKLEDATSISDSPILYN
ncbi:hypothetical protein DJ84_05845, partial [Halorubrum ezzemoulense]